MFAVYREDQIKDYAEGSLEFIGRYSEAQRITHRRDFARTISVLPTWQQILMIESGGSNVIARCKTLDEIRGPSEIEHAVGFFMMGAHSFKISARRQFNSVNGIFWASDAEQEIEPVIYHEHGHRIDSMIAERYFNGHSYYSSASSIWRKATKKQVTLSLLQSEARTEIAEVTFIRQGVHDDTEQLYEGYDRLLDHLQGYERENSCFHESFAQMNEHYCMLRARGDGEKTTHNKLQSHLPRLWPVFNVNARQYAVSLAKELYQKNHGAPVPVKI